MDSFTINQQIDELGYIIIGDLSDEELAELFETMINQGQENQ